MAAGQDRRRQAYLMPDPSDVALDRDSIAKHIAEAQERAHPLAGAMEARADLRSAVNWLVGCSPIGYRGISMEMESARSDFPS
jgi:hypothetical protein